VTLPDKHHLDHHFDEELASVKELLLRMGGHIEDMMGLALRALEERSALLARQVEAMDDQVDALEKEVDAACIALVARRQPAARDLRFIAAAFKIVTDLERIGDLVVNLCERVEDLGREQEVRPRVDLQRMGALVRRMLADALDAFVRGDADQARGIVARDSEIDELNARFFHEISAFMASHPQNVPPATALLFVTKYLERIADHAVNLARMVIFQVEGRDIRHQDPPAPGRL
jgi:phosphate transport system protein